MRNDQLIYKIDWLVVLVYFTLVFSGWLNIYAADYDPDVNEGILSFSQSSGKQLIWIATSVVLITFIMLMDFRFYDSVFAYVLYGVLILALLFVLLLGNEVAGSKSWIPIGQFKLQPSEFTKIAAALALAKFLSKSTRKSEDIKSQVIGFAFFLFPMVLIILQGDLGTAMVFGSLILVMFREGMHPMILVIGLVVAVLFLSTLVLSQTILLISIVVLSLLGIGLVAKTPSKIAVVVIAGVISAGFVKSVDFILTDVLKPHQQQRVMQLLNPNRDPLGAGWQVTQSKIAIGSGGLTGKGYLQGTQTKFNFVPDQTTDNIFCTVGEEQGWIGSFLLLAAFTTLLLRLVYLAERQKSPFARIYGYAVVSILFFHFAFNIAMTIGLFPVIGIPLPFFSYGGSSLWTFTILLFIFLKLDAHRMQVLQRL
ncbi:MAG: rod shape-determining protein RodA [Flammeovirgaceae bacterium]|nr:rod shape-determining protein RodA [Flammeovirgaceae bacterium]MBE63765.1 rod shape-determining protein RodA [Flammeovirgaceae bacterium]MBR07315.1 rod shape-determining protein RodA [Rickettsiales bacterium]HCX23197.1 rod shape-determining protein RodA [Cytophagales bacterium]